MANKSQQHSSKILRIGIVGAIITALCCFTPALVILLSMIGLSAIVVYLDALLFPLLFIFIVMIAYGFWQKASSNI